THRRWPSGKPRLRAFCRSAPAVRFMALTIFLTGDLLRECALSSRTSSFDQGRRLMRRARLVAINPSRRRCPRHRHVTEWALSEPKIGGEGESPIGPLAPGLAFTPGPPTEAAEGSRGSDPRLLGLTVGCLLDRTCGERPRASRSTNPEVRPTLRFPPKIIPSGQQYGEIALRPKGAQSIARQRRAAWRAQWAIPSRRPDQGRDCGAAEIQRIC